MEGPNTDQPFSVRFAPAEASVADEKTLKKCNKGRLVDKHERKRRNKFLFEGIRLELMELQKENEYLKSLVREKISPMSLAETILKEAEAPVVDIFLQNSVLLDEADEFDESFDESVGSEEEIPNVKSIATFSERSNTTKTTKTSASSDLTSEDTPRTSVASVENRNSNSVGTRKGILRKRGEKDAHKSGSVSTKSSVSGTTRRKKVLTHDRTDSKRMISYGKKMSNESLETKKSIATRRTIDTGAKSISTRKTTHSTQTLRASGTRRRTIGANLHKSPSRTSTNTRKIGFRSRSSKTDESATRKSTNTTGTKASSSIARRTRPSSNTTSSTLNQRTVKSDPIRRKPRDTSRPSTSTGLKKKEDPRPHSSPSTKRAKARMKSNQKEEGKSTPKQNRKQVEIKSPISSIGSDEEYSRRASIPRIVDVDIGDFSIEDIDENSSSERNLSRHTTRKIPPRVGSDVVVFHQEVESLAAALGGDLAF
ncbi:predicted protein [Chaetoceros tenuissimus]|uniref:Uncharacterized protein n=1 Tax=Chaetoceros tenuissimus TaxID=426638 RepID=A0AAD3HFK5_9STRA|nr:predicted protein [Chaetoceros tenuissimus]